MSDSVPVTYRMLGIELVNSGRVLALAAVNLEVSGVEVALQGVQIARNTSGGLDVKAPRWRHPRTGQWVPCLLLPPELTAALGAEVLAAYGAVLRSGS